VADKKKAFASLPTPINLEAPEGPEGYESPQKGRRTMPEFEPVGMPRGNKEQAPSDERGLGVFRAAQRNYGRTHEPHDFDEPRRRMPPPPPQIRPGEFPLRRKGIKKPVQNARREPSPFQKILQFRINPMYVSFVGWTVAAIAVVAVALWFITNLLVYNSFAVYLDDELIGHIMISDDLTPEEFHSNAVLHLQASLGGASVVVNERVTFEQARASGSERSTHNEIFAILNRKFTYSVAAIAIYVNGNREALMKTESDLAHVEHLLQRDWFNENTVGAEFVDGWETVVVYVPEETEFCTPEQAYWRLDRTTLQVYPYTVQRGDNLGVIAVRFGTTVPRIMSDNDLTSTNIFPGNTLMIQTYLPLLAVRTFDEIATDERIEMPVERRDNDELPYNVTNVIQEGLAGQQRSVLRIVRENGTERYRETLEAEIIIEPILHIIEVGTGEATVQRR